MPKGYYAYILSNKSKTLYTGTTNDLVRRVEQHRLGEGGDFTKRYHCHQLVWYALFDGPRAAIATEKRIKGWTRAKKIALIESMNPDWWNLSIGANRLKLQAMNNRRHTPEPPGDNNTASS